MKDLEFYETPSAFTRYLFRELNIAGNIFEPCVGDGAILRGSEGQWPAGIPDVHGRQWVTNDLDPRWTADYHEDARYSALWQRQGLDAIGGVDWTVSNPAFTPAIQIITKAIEHSEIGVAMHLRASIHEVLKTGIRRTWMAQHTPTGILWLPRFAYQRSKTKGIWQTDNVCACWVIWLKDRRAAQFIRYAPTRVIDQLDAETPAYRERMDELMGYAGTEAERQAQRIAA